MKRQFRNGIHVVHLVVAILVLGIRCVVCQHEVSGNNSSPVPEQPTWHTPGSDLPRPSDQIPGTNDDEGESQGTQDDSPAQEVTARRDSSSSPTGAGVAISTGKVTPTRFSNFAARTGGGQGQGDSRGQKVIGSQGSLTTVAASFGGDVGKTDPFPTGSWGDKELRSTVDRASVQWSETPVRSLHEHHDYSQGSGSMSGDGSLLKLPASRTSGYYDKQKPLTSADDFGMPRTGEDSYVPRTADSQSDEAGRQDNDMENVHLPVSVTLNNDSRKTNRSRATEMSTLTLNNSSPDAVARTLTTLKSTGTSDLKESEVTKMATPESAQNSALESFASTTLREFATAPTSFEDEVDFSTTEDLDRPASSDPTHWTTELGQRLFTTSETSQQIGSSSPHLDFDNDHPIRTTTKAENTSAQTRSTQPLFKYDNEASHSADYFQTRPKSDNRTSQGTRSYDYLSRTNPDNMTDAVDISPSQPKSDTVGNPDNESSQRSSAWQFNSRAPGTDSDRNITWTPPHDNEEDRTQYSVPRAGQDNTAPPAHTAENAAPEALLITKLESLQEGKLDSDLLYKAVEIGDGVTNSTTGAGGPPTAAGNEESETAPNSREADEPRERSRFDASTSRAELKQFHLPDDDCLYDVYGASGSLKFPDAERFPIASNSTGLVTCRWRVRVPEGPNVKLSVQRLALSLGVEQLEIAVGMDGELKKRAFTGSKVPRDLVTVGTRLWLTAKVRNDGYKDKIVVSFAQTAEEAAFPKDDNYTCGAILSDMSGNITSPGYSDQGHYENNQECSWYIVAPAQSVIRLTVRDFSTDVYDHVTMGIGLHAGAGSSRLLTLYGQLREERQTVIPASSLWIHFASDDSFTDRGFLLSYTVVPRDFCNVSNTLTSQEGLITSVNYPQLYPINSECTWYIRAPQGAFVNITFFDFFVEDGRDFLLIGEGTELFVGPFVTLTGNITDSNPMRVDSSNVWVHFTSDHLDGSQPYRGFSLSYQLHFYEKEKDDIKTAVTPPDPRDAENMVEQKQDRPMNDQGKGKVITIPLTGVKEQQLERNWKKFRSELKRVLNDRCLDKCSSKHKVTEDAITLLGARRDQGRLLVEVRVEADVNWPAHAMAATDYEELERLFHSDLQSLDLKNANASDDVSAHLPEWLIGVIVVVILLIVAFFAMVIYSLMKERKKNRAGSYGGTTSPTTGCEDVEVGKADSNNIRITAFSLEQGGGKEITDGLNGQAVGDTNGAAWTLDAEVASTLQRRQHGVSGCMNPAFIDEEAEEKDSEGNDGRGNGHAASAGAGQDGTENAASSSSATTANGKAPADTKRSESPASQLNDCKGHKGELLEMNEHATSSQGQGQGEGHGNGKLNNLSKDSSSDGAPDTEQEEEEETAIDNGGRDGGENGAGPSRPDDEGGASSGGTNHHERASWVGPEPSTSSGSSGPRQLEVVLDRDTPPSDPQACVMVHMDKDSKQGDMGSIRESSTDEKDGPGMSTNL